MTDAGNDLEEARLKEFEKNIKHAVGCPSFATQRSYLNAAGELADQIVSEGKISSRTASRLEKGFLRVFNDAIEGANGSLIGPAQRYYLNTAYELAGKILSVEGKITDAAAGELEEGLLKVFNFAVKGANGCYPGDAQREYLDLADEIAGEIKSIEGGLGDHAASEIKKGFTRVFDKLMESADRCCPGAAKKNYLDLAKEIENKIASIQPAMRKNVGPPEEVLQAIAKLNTPRA